MQPEEFEDLKFPTLISPPPDEKDLYRVVYTIDVNACTPKEAAKLTQRIMTDPDSMAPVLHVIDAAGENIKIDLSMLALPGVNF